jgi:hypothetical protein
LYQYKFLQQYPTEIYMNLSPEDAIREFQSKW